MLNLCNVTILEKKKLQKSSIVTFHFFAMVPLPLGSFVFKPRDDFLNVICPLAV